MRLNEHFDLMAAYNQWMNGKVYQAASNLDEEALFLDRGAFFRSIFGTLNHLVVGDTIWLKRFATHPASANILSPVTELQTPTRLDQTVCADFGALWEHRQWLDEQIIGWVSGLTDLDLDFTLTYHNTKGVSRRMRLSPLIFHFFNHQTHHRGQVTTLLSQAGEDVGVTDLFALIPNESQQDETLG